MANEVDRELLGIYCARFGEIAVKKGFIHSDQAKEAISEQMDDDLNNKPHRLIGKILMDKGWMTYQQIELVLKDLFNKQRD